MHIKVNFALAKSKLVVNSSNVSMWIVFNFLFPFFVINISFITLYVASYVHIANKKILLYHITLNYI